MIETQRCKKQNVLLVLRSRQHYLQFSKKKSAQQKSSKKSD